MTRERPRADWSAAMETRAEALRRGLNETLDSIVSAAVRETLLAEALDLVSSSELPTETGALHRFLRGPLRQTLERALGRELGESVTEELQRIIESLPAEAPSDPAEARSDPGEEWPEALGAPRAAFPEEGFLERSTESDVWVVGGRRFTLPAGSDPAEAPGAQGSDPVLAKERRSRAPTQPEQLVVRFSSPASGDFPSGTAQALGIGAGNSSASQQHLLPMVFIATRDSEMARRFTGWLDPRAVVVRVARLIDLLLDLEDVGTRRTVVVFDLRKPPFRPEALAAVAEELPTESRVLLWGGTRESQFELTSISPRVTRWIACPESMPFTDVIDRCSKLVG